MPTPLRLPRLVVAAVLLALGGGVPSAQPAGGAVWYVDADASGAATGASWADAFTDLQLALAAAQPGDEVWVAEGVYRPTAGADRAATFRLASGVALYGGFEGTETTRDTRDWAAHETVLSGDVGVAGDSLDNSYHIVTAEGVDRSAVLDGFTVEWGMASAGNTTPPPLDRGGGLYAPGGSPTVRNAVFRRNGARRYGGGVYVEGGSPLIEDAAFRDNGGTGAGVYANGGAPELRRVSFRGSRGRALTFAGGSGGVVEDAVVERNPSGGALIVESSPSLVRCAFRANGDLVSGPDGGGVHIEGAGARPVFEDCLFEDNRASGYGGGVHVEALAEPAFLRTTFRANQAGSGSAVLAVLSTPLFLGCLFEHNRGLGSALASNTAAPVIMNSIFRGNTATMLGAALVFYLNAAPVGEALVVNTTVVGNEAYGTGGDGHGGGVVLASGAPVRFVNVTLAGNRAAESGGAVYALDGTGAVFQNVVLWGNEAPVGPEIHVAEGSPSVERAIVAGGYTPGTAILDAAPLFVRAPFVGADGRWGTDDDDYGDLRLQEGSPALDFGLTGLLPADVWDLDADGDTTEAIPVDLAGGPRVAGASVDLGAYEGAVAVAAEGTPGAAGGLVLSVRPSPARGAATLALTLPRASASVRVAVYDALGRAVAVVHDGPLGAGAHRLAVDAATLAPGVYVVRAVTEGGAVTARLVVVR